MPKFLIERDIPGAGKASAADLKNIAAQSNRVNSEMGPRIQWLHSYVTENKVVCIYVADSEQTVREQAERSGAPVTAVARVHAILDPASAE